MITIKQTKFNIGFWSFYHLTLDIFIRIDDRGLLLVYDVLRYLLIFYDNFRNKRYVIKI